MRLSRMAFLLSAGVFILAPSPAQAQTITRMSLQTKDLAYDATSGKIYASVPGSAGANGNSIAVIDPATATVAQYIPLGGGTEPGRLALSSDGRYLYVGLNGAGAVRRIDLSQRTGDLQFSLGLDSWGVPERAGDMAVQPSNGDVVAVVAEDKYGYSQPVAIYDNGVKRPQTPAFYVTTDLVVFGTSPSVLYGFDNTDTGFDFTRLLVDANGVTAATSAGSVLEGWNINIHFAGGRVYGGDGSVIDPDAITLVGKMTGNGSYATVVADPGANIAFFLRASTGTLAAYDTNTFLPLWSFTVPNAGIDIHERHVLLRWASSGLAFRNADTVFLIDFSTVPAARTLRVNRAGSGTGSVSSSDGSINCGTNCIAQVASGTSVTLTATAGSASTFSGWSGDADCSDGIVTVGTDTSCTATFSSAVARPSIRRLALRTNDLAYDPNRGRLYASVTGAENGIGNSIVSIDPTTGELGSRVWVGSEPNALALSRDLLYVGLDGAAAIRRLNLAGGSVDLQFGLGGDSFFGPLRAESIAIQPDADGVIAVSRRYFGVSPRHAGVAIYQDGVQRPTTTATHTGSNVITFTDNPSDLFGYNNETTDFGFRHMSVDSNGVSVVSAVPGLIASFGAYVRYAGGRIYSSAGQVVDPATSTRVGIFPNVGSNALMVPDPGLDVVFFLKDNAGTSTLTVYDPATYRPIWSVDLPVGDASSSGSLLRWGSSGLAFRTPTTVYLLDFASAISTPRVLRVNKAGTGRGTVTTSEGGISCGTTCSATFTSDTTVTLTAVAAGDSTFAGWTGAADCADGIVTMSAPVTCTATFTATTSETRPSITRLALAAKHTVYDPVSARIYASIGGSDSTYGNSVIAIEPTSGQVTNAVWMGSEPNRIARSEDGRSLYVGLDGAAAVRRLDLESGIPDPPLGLGMYWAGPMHATDIAVQPDGDSVIAVALPEGLAVFDNGVKGSASLPSNVILRYIKFGLDPSILYGVSAWSDNAFLRMSVSTNAASVLGSSTAALDEGAAIDFHAGRMYVGDGQVINPDTFERLGAFPPSSSWFRTFVAVNPLTGLVFLIGERATDPTIRTVAAYDPDSYRLVWAAEIPVGSDRVRGLITWGESGVAVTTDTALFVADMAGMTSVRTLAARKVGSGSGSVISSSGINCGDVCVAQSAVGSVVVLTATPSADSVFSGWSGDPDCADGQVTITDGVVCTATFTRMPQLWLSKAGTGTGTVNGNPTGSPCGSGCTYFASGSVVTLTVAPAADSVFTGWWGDSDCSDGAVTMSGDRHCTAEFRIRAQDFNWDGHPDIVWRNRSNGQIDIWLMSGLSLGSEGHPSAPTDQSWEIVAAADFDNDGDTDLVLRNRVTGANQVWYMSGTSHQSTGTIATVTDLAWQIVAATDFNGDGKPDLLWQHAGNGAVGIWYMNGVTAVDYAQVASPGGVNWEVAATDDFDGDGKVDLLWRNRVTGQVRIWYLNGAAYKSESSLSAQPDLKWVIIGTGDFNGDHAADIIWHNMATGENKVVYVSGGVETGSDLLPPIDPQWLPIGPAGRYNPRGRADLDWDGNTDLVLQDSAGDAVAWLMHGTTLGASQPLMAGGSDWRVAAVADLDGDGGADIVWQHPTGMVAVWLMNRTSMRQALLLSDAPTDWRLVGAGDLDGDGKTDLVWQHPAGFVAVWLMNGTTFKTGVLLSGGLTDWRVVATGDFDGDSKTDLVWQHPTGIVAVWLMDGLTFRTGSLVSGAATDWRVIGAGHFNGDASPDLVWRHPNGDIRIWPTVGLVLDGLPIIVGTIL